VEEEVNHLLYRRLGRTGILVSEISFGAHLKQVNIVDRDRRYRQIQVALENGINLFDIYDHSGYKQWEPMSEWLQPVRDSVLISLCTVWNPDKVLDEVDYALKVFRTDHIDLYRFVISENAEENGKRLHALLQAKAEGKIQTVGGVCHVPSLTVKALKDYPIELEFLMLPATFCFPRALSQKTRIGHLINQLDTGVIVMKPFTGHVGDAPAHLFELNPRDPELEDLKRKGLRLGKAILKALLQYPLVSTVMPSMDEVEEVLENVSASGAGALTGEEERLLEGYRRELFSKDPKTVLKEHRWMWNWRLT